MNMPDYLEGRAAELLSIEEETATRKNHWAVVLGLHPVQDGDQYCILWGENLQTGVAAFGGTPTDAILEFDKAMYAKINRPDVPANVKEEPHA